MISDIGAIISSSFSSPLTKTLIGSATEIAKGNFNSQVIAQQIVAIAKESPKIDLNEQQVKNVVDLIREETLRIGAKSVIDLPRIEPPAAAPMIVPQAAEVNEVAQPHIVQAEPPALLPQLAAPAAPTVISPYFKLILLTLVGVTAIAGAVAISFSVFGGTLNQNQQTIFDACLKISETGITAILGFVGAKAT